MADEGLQIKITAPKAADVAKVLGDLNEKLLSLAKNASKVDLDNEKTKDAVKTFEQMTKGVISYAKAINETNKINRDVALSELRIAEAREKSAAAIEKMKNKNSDLVTVYGKQQTELKKLENTIKELIASGNTNASELKSLGNEYISLQDKIKGTETRFKELTTVQEATIQKAKEMPSVYSLTKKSLSELEAKIKEQVLSGEASNAAINELATTYKNLQAKLKGAEERFKELTTVQQKTQQQEKTMLSDYEIINKELKTRAARLKELLASSNANNQAIQIEANAYKVLKENLNTINSKFKELTITDRELAEAQKSVTKTTLTAKVALANFIALQVSTFVNNLIYGFKDLVVNISKAGIQLDALRNTFAAATGGWQQGGKEMQWLTDMSNRLGLGFGNVSDSYAKFMTSFTRSGGTIEQSRQIFEDISAAMVNLHLPAERMQGVFVALEQMANKGTVQAEELKKQLGNALPAAFEIGAESMGVLPAKLMDMMKAGKVFSKDFLPNFAKAVKENLGQGIDIATNQFNASLGRLNTATTMFQMQIGQMVNEGLKPLVDISVPVVNALANMAQFFNENATAGALFKGVLIGGMIPAVVSLVSLIKQVGVALVATYPALAAINISLGGLPLIIGGVVAALAALGFNLADANKKAADVTPYMNLNEQFVEFTKSVTALDTSTEEGKLQLEAYKEQFPQLTQYLIDNKKTLDQLTQSDFAQIEALGIADKKTQILAERTKYLNSWQATVSATIAVAWRKISTVISAACQVAGGWIDWLKDKIKKTADAINNFFGITTSGAINKSTRLIQDYEVAFDKAKKEGNTTEMAYWSNLIKNEEKTLQTLKEQQKIKEKTNKGIGNQKQGGKGFWSEVNDEKITRATEIMNEKLGKVEKTSQGAARRLNNAKTAYVGFDKATGGSKTKSTKTTTSKTQKTPAQTEWDNSTKEIKTLGTKILAGNATQEEEQKYIKLKKAMDDAKGSLKEMTMSESDLFSLKQQRLTQLEQEIKLGLYQGQNVDTLITQYNAEKQKLDEVSQAFSNMTTEQDNSYEGLKKQEKIASDLYKSMLLNSSQYTQNQIDQQAKTVKELKLKAKEVELEEKHQEALQVTQRTVKGFSDTVIDSLFNTLDGSESLWDSFKDSAISAFKTIAAVWAKDVVNRMLLDIQEGFSSGGIKGALQNGLAGLLGNSMSSSAVTSTSLNISNGGFLSNLFGSTKATTASNGLNLIPIQDELDNLSFSAQNLGQTFLTETTPSIDSALNSLSFFGDASSAASNAASSLTSPLASATSALSTVASSTPIAAGGIGAMGTTLTTLAPLCTSAAPALTTMAAALTTIATEASAAATAMAALAVATAAESVAKIPLVGGFLAPVAAAATGAAIAAGALMTGAGIAAGSVVSGAGQAIGGNLSKLGSSTSIIPHAKGGVVSSPTTFPMAGGNIGLAGEAGTEVIAPAKRMSNGELGIGAVQPNVTVNNYSNAAVEVIKRPNNEMEIKIKELNAMLSSSRTNRGFGNAQQRLSTKGKQIG